MIKHIVMWTIKDADGRSKEENIELFKQKLERLPETIEEIKDLEVGLNFNTLGTAMDVILISEFENHDALQRYQEHPDHVRVKEFVAKICDRSAVVDYEF